MASLRNAMTGFLLGMLLIAPLPGTDCAVPASGYLCTASFGADSEGKPRGQKRFERIWFRGPDTRTESWIGDRLAMVTVQGDAPWTAFPAAGRILPDRPPPKEAAPYPESVRRTFEQVFAKRQPVGTVRVKGLLCWKYAWHEEKHVMGDLASPAQDVTYWVYADRQLPIVVQYEASTGGRRELVELKLGAPVAEALSRKPDGLAPVRAFSLPEKGFRIELEMDRGPAGDGWTTHQEEVFSADAGQVTHTFRSVTTHANGEKSNFAPAAETLTFARAKEEVWRRLQTPDWFTVKKVGQEKVLEMPADRLDRIIEGMSEERYWVADHPILGTVCLRRIGGTGGETMRVTRIEIEGPRR